MPLTLQTVLTHITFLLPPLRSHAPPELIHPSTASQLRTLPIKVSYNTVPIRVTIQYQPMRAISLLEA